MIPDTPSITFVAELTCLGKFVCQIRGRAYSLDNAPALDVVTWLTDDDEEVIMDGPYGTPREDAIREVLLKAANSEINRSRLHESFCEEQDQLRLAAAGDAARSAAE